MANPKVAIVWRGDRATRDQATPSNNRMAAIFAALADAGIDAEPAVYDETFAEEVRAQILQADGVLVWVNPLADGKTRKALDATLREVADAGVWVSAHPDIVAKMGTKDVLVRTKSMGWGTDTHRYGSAAEFRDAFPSRLAEAGPRILKRLRGNGGQGVWKVEKVSRSSGPDASVRVLEARKKSVPHELPLGAFLAQCEAYFADGGAIIDQPFQDRLPDGMIRCYMAGDKAAGFGHQLIKALIPPPPEGPNAPEAQPGPRIMHPSSAPQFERLRQKMEADWTPQMMRLLDISPSELPIIWDADFLYGPRDKDGNNTYVLCEINVSSVFAVPDEAPAAMARLVRSKLDGAVVS
ncbi:MAG: Cj0069 family protein [Alphaproteobacteria bacterium]|nr:Cj0069 family protein [Alphaproteobacteria bacterium]